MLSPGGYRGGSHWEGRQGMRPASMFPVSSPSRAGLRTNSASQSWLACVTPHALSGCAEQAGRAAPHQISSLSSTPLHLSTLACRQECNVMCDGIQGTRYLSSLLTIIQYYTKHPSVRRRMSRSSRFLGEFRVSHEIFLSVFL